MRHSQRVRDLVSRPAKPFKSRDRHAVAAILFVCSAVALSACGTSPGKGQVAAPHVTLAASDDFAAAQRAFQQPIGIEQPAEDTVLDGGSGSAPTRPAVPDERADTGTDLTNGVGPRPVRLFVSSIQVDAPVQPVGLTKTGELEVPVKADIPGWWSGGHVPGQPGPTVIVGHLDSKVAVGVFIKLREIRPGDRIFVLQSDGTIFSYLAERVSQRGKTDFPTEEVYGPTSGSTLRLITCGGTFDHKTGHYLDNIIVFAKLENFDAGLASAASNATPSIETTTTLFPPSSTSSSTIPSSTVASSTLPTTSIERPTTTTASSPSASAGAASSSTIAPLRSSSDSAGTSSSRTTVPTPTTTNSSVSSGSSPQTSPPTGALTTRDGANQGSEDAAPTTAAKDDTNSDSTTPAEPSNGGRSTRPPAVD